MAEKDDQMRQLLDAVSNLQKQVTDLRASVTSQTTFTFDFNIDYDPAHTETSHERVFYVPSPSHYKLQLRIESRLGYVAAFLDVLEGRNDSSLSWPVTAVGQLILLNQADGDHGHHTVGFTMTADPGSSHKISYKFFSNDRIRGRWDSETRTNYFKDSFLHLRLHIKVTPA